VQTYHFTIRSADGGYREQTGFMTLDDDAAAHEFGKLVIQDMTQANAEPYAGWSMDVASGQRAVCSIPF
jgi:hypothetical protein